MRRHNGKSHEHRNPIEARAPFYGFHIHMATERYQDHGMGEEDKYAEPTDRYGDYEGAWRCFVSDCNLQLPPGDQDDQLDLAFPPPGGDQ